MNINPKIASLFLVIFLLPGCGEKIDAKQSQNVQGLIYKINASEPYTGKLTNFPISDLGLGIFTHDTCDVAVKTGVIDGNVNCKSGDGIKVADIDYKDGKLDGTLQMWDSNTKNLILKSEWKSGAKNGKEERYDAGTGKVIASLNWLNDVKNGEEKIWNLSGTNLIVNLTWENGNKSGFEKTDQDEINYKNGEREGMARNFALKKDNATRYLNSETNYVSGKEEGKATQWDEDGNIIQLRQYKNGIIQSQLSQKWKEGKIIATKSLINVSDGGIDDRSSALQKDGKEHDVSEENGVVSVFDIDWSRGKALKGSFEERKGDKVATTYSCVSNPASYGLVKDGTERKWDDAGNLIVEIAWQQGVATSMSTRLEDGRVLKADHPELNPLQISSQCPVSP